MSQRCAIEELSWPAACLLTREYDRDFTAWIKRVRPPLWSTRPEHSIARVDYDLGTVWARERAWLWAIQINTRHYLGDLFGWVPAGGGP